jgi:hypothetical protein
MPRHFISTIVTGVAGLAALLIVLTDNPTLAADDCRDQPTHEPSATGHWYYRLDAASHRKCWYLVEQTSVQRAAAAAHAQEPGTQPGLLSFFDSLRAGFTGANPSASEPAAPTVEARNQTTAQVDHSKVKRQHGHPAAPRSRSDPAAEPSDPPLTDGEREALFRQFLQWRTQHLLD